MGVVQAHKGENHIKQSVEVKSSSASEKVVLREINEEYVKKIKPIFQRSCMNCHSSHTEYPWYYSLPGVKQLIDHDLREAKVHLDMSKDFPFVGHGSPQEDLASIKNSVEKNMMPPWRYQILHWSSKIELEEVKLIQDWVKSSSERLNKIEKER